MQKKRISYRLATDLIASLEKQNITPQLIKLAIDNPRLVQSFVDRLRNHLTHNTTPVVDSKPVDSPAIVAAPIPTIKTAVNQ